MAEKVTRYTAEFKQTIVNLYHSGKSYSQIHNEYGISSSALSNWVKQYSEVKIDDDTVPQHSRLRPFKNGMHNLRMRT